MQFDKFTFYISILTEHTNNANARKLKRSEIEMAKNVVPEAKEALNRFKMEAASEVGVPRPS